MTFAIITPALITGATADRLKFSAYAVFIGCGWSSSTGPSPTGCSAAACWPSMGALDFAGGAVVHMNAGAAALALVIVLGVRKGYPETPMPPHNLPLTMLGTGILWFGWAGFNAGSALAANGVAAQAIMNTFLAASAAMLGWLVVEKVRSGHATTLGAASGAVAGLVAITPCAGFVGGMAPVYIGARHRRGLLPGARHQAGVRLDDSLDVIAVHLVGGLLGSLLLGLFADAAINPRSSNEGLFLGGGLALLGDQVVASVVTLAYSFVVTLHHRPGHQQDDGSAHRSGAGGRGPRPQPPRRGGLRQLSRRLGRLAWRARPSVVGGQQAVADPGLGHDLGRPGSVPSLRRSRVTWVRSVSSDWSGPHTWSRMARWVSTRPALRASSPSTANSLRVRRSSTPSSGPRGRRRR